MVRERMKMLAEYEDSKGHKWDGGERRRNVPKEEVQELVFV